jgi:serine protease Do
MTMINETRPASSGFLARHRRSLMAGVFGLGVLGLAAGDMVVLQPSSAAIAAPQTVTGVQAASGFAEVVERVSPAVVSVKVKTSAPQRQMMSNDDFSDMSPDDPMYRFFRQFGFGEGRRGGDEGQGRVPNFRQRKQFGMSQGSGFFISADGYVVTNNHVVDNGAEVDIVTNEGKTYTAKVIGTDPKTDLALLKVNEGGDFPYVELASQPPRVGDWVLAVGNPYGLGGTVTAGIVSARGRDIGSGPYDDFLQIDAPVNRGNSGGPTFDTSGRVIGVNTAIFSPSGGSIGIGFAIPSDTVQRVVDDLKSNGQVTRGWIGIQIQPVTDEIADSLGLSKASGALVADVTGDSPAAKAGLKAGDAITAVNGQAVSGPRELARTIAAIRPGSDAKLTVWRDGKETEISVATAKLPTDQQASAQEPSKPAAPTSLADLGIELAPAASVAGAGESGVVVTDVDPTGSAGDDLKTGDVILEVAGKPVQTVADVEKGITAVKSEGRKSVLIRVKSGNATRFVALPVGKA